MAQKYSWQKHRNGFARIRADSRGFTRIGVHILYLFNKLGLLVFVHLRMFWKKELSRQYSTSCRWFTDNVHSNRALMNKLEATGYRVRQKTLNKKQRDIITDHLGEP